MSRVSTVDEYISRNNQWFEELNQLRQIFLSTGMKETVKWGMPTYTIDGKNVAGLGAFKSYVGIWFHNGALLKDRKNLLINAQEGKTAGLRQMRFNSAGDIVPLLVMEYVNEAIENQKQGRVIKPKRNKELILPEQLAKVLESDAKLNQRFRNLSKGRQREYAEYIAEAKREDTKQSRIEKIKPQIRAGKGLNDKYKSN